MKVRDLTAVNLLLLLLVAATTATAQAAIRAGCEIDYPPFCIVPKSGPCTGFSVELMRAALRAMGKEVTFRTGPWADVKGWLTRGEVDALPLVGRTPEREELFDFTVPYLTMHGAIVVRRETTGINSLADLRGKKVAVMAEDNAEEFLRRQERGLEILTTPTFADAFRALSAGNCEAVVIQRLVALRLLAETGLTNLRIVEQPIDEFSQDFCFAVREGDRETLALLNEGLALVVADGTLRQLHSQWFARFELPTDRPIVIAGSRHCPPFEFIDQSGRPQGFAVDITRAIARQMDMNVQIRLGPRGQSMQALQAGEIDAIQGMLYSPERDRVLDFTPRYQIVHYVSVVRRGSGEPPTTMDELKGRDLGVQADSAILDTLRMHGVGSEAALLETQEDVMREVAEGRLECGLVSRAAALSAMAEHGWTNLRLGAHPLYSGGYCYAVRHGNDALLAELADGLRMLKETGEYQRIYEKWLGTYETRPRWHDVLRYAALTVAPLLLIAVLASLWSWSLRRKVAQRTAELAALSQRHEVILAELPDIIMEVDQRKVYVWANPAGLAFFGDGVVGREAEEYFVGEQETYETVQPLFGGDETVVYLESRQRRRDGEIRLLAWWCHVLKDESGTTIGALSTARDITDQRRAEEQLRRSEALLNTAQHIASIGGWEWDVVQERLFWTKETYRIHDLDPDQPTGDLAAHVERSAACYSEEDRPRVLAAFHACVESGVPYELECRFTSALGRQLWVRTSGQAELVEGHVVRVYGDIQDITAHKQAEDELARVAREWQTTFDSAHDVIWLLDADQRVVRSNRTAEVLFSRSAAEIVGRPCWEIVHGQARPPADCPVLRVRKSLRRESMEMPMGDRWLEITVDPILGEDGHYEGAVHVVRDITEHRRQEETVRRLNRVLRAIRDVNQLIVRENDPRRLIETASRLLVEDRSYRAALIVLTDGGNRPTEYAQAGMDHVHPQLTAWLADGALPPCCEAMETPGEVRMFATPNDACRQCPAGKGCPGGGVACIHILHGEEDFGFLVVAGTPRLGADEEERGLLAEVAGDIGYALHTLQAHAAREQAERARDAVREQLLQAQKMESVGRLAGGVAHDFNNKLMTILGYGELCQAELPASDPLRECVDEIVDAARRSAALTRQLLAFARKQAIEPVVLDLNETIAGMLKMLHRLIGENISLVWKPGSELRPVLMDPAQVDQILANLAVNARDAIDGTGTVTVATASRTVAASLAATSPGAEPGDYLVLTVMDDGCGMDAETLAHLFEPFFTTKETGKGTGLGLATVYGIVRQNGGFVAVHSAPGEGSTFELYLPHCAADRAGTGEEQIEEEAMPCSQGETVLVVEDEDPLLRSCARLLATLGYKVLAAPSAADAIRLSDGHPGTIDVLLTDVVMPEMNGRELRDALAVARPEMRCVFMSGYTTDIIAQEGVLASGVHFLQKPFSQLQLAHRLREALESPAS